MASLSELAEDTMAYLLSSPTYQPLERDGYVFVSNPKAVWITRIRRVDVDAVRREAAGRKLHWWPGWSSPPDIEATLVAAGCEPEEPGTLTGMTCIAEPPGAPEVEIREAAPAEVVAVEHAVWGGTPNPLPVPNDVERNFAALLDGCVVGIGRSVDMHGAVALLGGVVLPDARGRGVYRALVRARWDHAASLGTPCLAVQAGPMSAPILSGLGFRSHGEVRTYVDGQGRE